MVLRAFVSGSRCLENIQMPEYLNTIKQYLNEVMRLLLISAGGTVDMCLKRDNDDNCDKFLNPFPILDTIDLTIDELGDDDDFVEIIPIVDQWNYPYNLLPSSDEEELARDFISPMEDNNGDVHYTHSSTNHGSSNEINQNANTQSASININSHARGFISHMEDNNGDIHYTRSSTTHGSSNEINQNANTQSASVNINFNISEINSTNQSSENREFELNIPQILLSMSRISYNLYNRSSSSQD